MLPSSADRQPLFQSTDWSVVHRLHGPDASRALATLCESYWYPVYAFFRSRTKQADAAQDLTQGFFTDLIERNSLRQAAPERGRLRSFLLTSARNFMSNHINARQAERRGGRMHQVSLDFAEADFKFQRQVISSMTPERTFERSWTLLLLDRIILQLADESHQAGASERFLALRPMLTGEISESSTEDVAQQLGMTPAAVRQAASRLRKRYRELLKAEVASTLVDNADLDDEIQRLFQSLQS